MSISQPIISALATIHSRADLPAFAARLGLPPIPNIPQRDLLIEMEAANSVRHAFAALADLAQHGSPEVRRRSYKAIM